MALYWFLNKGSTTRGSGVAANEEDLSDEGSVDIEGESEDELLDEYEGADQEGGEGADGDEMEVDRPEPAVHKQPEAMVH